MTRNRDDIVAAAFAAAGPKLEFDPLRAQKLLFLIDQVVSGRIGGPFFNFRPYLYDPFDRVVYDAIQNLVAAGYAQTDTAGPYQRHVLTDIGYRHGVTVLGSLPNPVADYFGRTAMWVLLVPYRWMLAAIYREYPEMASNSVVQDLENSPERGEQAFVRGMASAFDLMGTMNRLFDSADGFQSDADAIRNGWRAVSADLEGAMVEFGWALVRRRERKQMPSGASGPKTGSRPHIICEHRSTQFA